MSGSIQRFGVLGAGTMGSGIIEVAIKNGLDVLAFESNEDLVAAGKSRLEKSLSKAVSKGKLSEQDKEQALSRVRFTTDLKDFSDRQVVVEAIIENEDIKKSVFSQLDEVITDPQAILATNTSSIPVTRIAKATKNPQRVIGLHFFNPVPVLKLVEIIVSPLSGEDTVERAKTFATEQLGKTPVVAKDRSGFIVNFLLIPYLLAAVRMVEQDVATPEDIDTAMKLGASYPLGPLALADLVGLDVCKLAADSLYEEYKEPQYAPSPLLNRMVEAGYLGRKTGKGFYTYDQ